MWVINEGRIIARDDYVINMKKENLTFGETKFLLIRENEIYKSWLTKKEFSYCFTCIAP